MTNLKNNVSELKAPHGMIIDMEASTIVYKPIIKPKWKQIGKIKGYIIDEYSDLLQITKREARDQYRNVWPSIEEANAALALSQLLQWRDKYNDGFKIDWLSSNIKYCLFIKGNSILRTESYSESRPLAFKSERIRDKFLEDFKDLIEIAKPLL